VAELGRAMQRKLDDRACEVGAEGSGISCSRIEISSVYGVPWVTLTF
jgi:hypothetical protein